MGGAPAVLLEGGRVNDDFRWGYSDHEGSYRILAVTVRFDAKQRRGGPPLSDFKHVLNGVDFWLAWRTKAPL